MAYLNCGRCGLEIKVQAAFQRVENCPRCLARTATVMPMVLSTSRVTLAAGWGQRASDQANDPDFEPADDEPAA